MDITIIIKGFLIGWLIANFEPLQQILNKYVRPHIKWLYVSSALSCHKCLGLWYTLIAFQDIYSAIAVALLAFVFEKIIYSIPTRL